MQSTSRPGIRWILAGLLCLLASLPVQASRVRPLNLEQLTASADRVVAGRVTEVQVVLDEQLGRPVTRVTLEVERIAKGQVATVVTITLFGDQTLSASSTTPRPGLLTLPGFVTGEELVLFLYPKSDFGLTSPIGLAQGRFAIYQDGKGGRTARNPYGNAGLLGGLSQEALDVLEATGRSRSDLDAKRLAPDELLDLVEALVDRAERPVGAGE